MGHVSVDGTLRDWYLWCDWPNRQANLTVPIHAKILCFQLPREVEHGILHFWTSLRNWQSCVQCQFHHKLTTNRLVECQLVYDWPLICRFGQSLRIPNHSHSFRAAVGLGIHTLRVSLCPTIGLENVRPIVCGTESCVLYEDLAMIT